MSNSEDTLDGAGTQPRLRVLVVDDHDVVHWGFRTMLGNLPWVERTLSARTGAEAYELAARYKPDVALVDVFIGGGVRSRHLRAVAGALAGHQRVADQRGRQRLARCGEAASGAAGFIPKDWGGADIARAVRMVGLGMTVFQPQHDGANPTLTPREREVLDLMARGSTNREIAEALHLSPHTIHEHTSGLYRKLGARNRADAVQRAARLGLIS